MYGSIHTHFESQYDTGNDKANMVKNFISSGAKRVAVTEHGVFSSYEDLKEIVDSIKHEAEESGKEVPEFDIIPGVEGYFGEDAAHLILIAKDYDGYLSLCKIISESNENIVKGKPIITLENLQKNVRKGHLICTSACIAGPFGRLLGLEQSNLEEKIAKLDEDLEKSHYREYASFINLYEQNRAAEKDVRPTKTEIASAEKINKKTGNDSLITEMKERITKADALRNWLDENKSAYDEKIAHLKKINASVYKRKQTNYEEYKLELSKLQERVSNGEMEMDAHILLQNFLDIFGEKNFYFELQNHGIDKEETIYNNIISFAYQAGHPLFVASNDIHVGVRKDDPSYEKMLLRRNVIKYTRFNTYTKETADDREYTIKNDEELREELLKIIKDVSCPDGIVSAEEIVDGAIKNIEETLKGCAIEFPKNQNHYPKFCDNENEEFERKVREGIKIKFPDGFPSKEYEERLEYELDVIKKMGYAGYHLIVADYLAYGRLLGYLPTAEEIANAPMSIEKLDAYITEKGYPRIGYSIGPGRGSAVGSLCCYLMGITDIDPMPYGLLFERFLNVERVSMPDIDSDFRTDIRAKVVDYCRAKYGAECICQIMTKSYGATKGNLRLAARYLGAIECESNPQYKKLEEELMEVNYMISANPDIKAKKEQLSTEISQLKKQIRTEKDETIKEELLLSLEKMQDTLAEVNILSTSLKSEYKEKKESIIKEMDGFLKTWYNRADKLAKEYDALGEQLPQPDSLPPEERRIVEIAETLDGVFTGYGQHAAGTIISGDDVTNVLPLMWNDKKESMETQCTMAQAESKGLLKMDFLGLKNLDIITDVTRHPTKKSDMDGRLQNYKEREKILKDPAIYKDIFCTGLTQGVFQFESPGMKKMLIEFQPESFEDIILLVAAYRPGPMDYIPEIIAQKWYIKNGKQGNPPKRSITLKNDALDAILSPTYGCPIYQEQIMQIFQQMAGYSLGGADIVRRYMSKKKEEKLAKEKKAFIYGDEKRNIPGCIKLHGLTEKEASDLFEQMMPFAKYGFNKSHATAYAMVAIFTAYLKKYHTADFFRSSLNAIKELKEIPDFVKEMPAFGLELKKPSMQYSRNTFSVDDDGKTIHFGLKYVKGFSEQNIHRCATLQEFIERNRDVSLKTIEKYIKIGMFDGCWTIDKKYGRVNGNRHECLRWLSENGKIYTKFLEKVEAMDALAVQKEELERSLSTLGNEDRTSLEKDLKKIKDKLASLAGERAQIADTLNHNRQNDYSRGDAKKESGKEVLENRAWEIDMLSLPFDVENSLKKIRNCSNQKTFAALQTPIKENGGSQTIRIPAVVLSVSEPKKTKKSSAMYHDVVLMDRDKNIITRRFTEKPDVLDGEFAVMLDECKFFSSTMKSYKPLYFGKGRTYVFPDAGTDEKIKAVRFGGKVEYIPTAGRCLVPIVKVENTEEEREYGG